MTLPLAEHGDVVTCTNGHRVGTAERLLNKPADIVDDFAMKLEPHVYGRDDCPICAKPFWRRGKPTAELHVMNKGWVSTTAPCRIAATVAREIEARAVMGMAKYGTTVADSPLERKQWLQHAYEEACDLAVYLRKLIDMENAT